VHRSVLFVWLAVVSSPGTTWTECSAILEAFPLTCLTHNVFPRSVVGCFERVWNHPAPRPPPGNRRSVRTSCRLYDYVIFEQGGGGGGRLRAGHSSSIVWEVRAGKGGK
jgi:hypothetical protein